MLAKKINQFLKKPFWKKMISLRYRMKLVLNFVCPFIPVLVRLPYGGWWIARNDYCSDSVFAGNFEVPERKFVENVLKEGMVVFDIGAHHGFYTLLASKKVGCSGQVVAFEPSPRERNKLKQHLKLNCCKNVCVEPYALHSMSGEQKLFLVEGKDTGCNALRKPFVEDKTSEIYVESITLDEYCQKNGLKNIDFIKMDVEGAELDALKGMQYVLEHHICPVFLCEVDDNRTNAWGYKSVEIIKFLAKYDYEWFGLNQEGKIVLVDSKNSYNLVAIPKKKRHLVSNI